MPRMMFRTLSFFDIRDPGENTVRQSVPASRPPHNTQLGRWVIGQTLSAVVLGHWLSDSNIFRESTICHITHPQPVSTITASKQTKTKFQGVSEWNLTPRSVCQQKGFPLSLSVCLLSSVDQYFPSCYSYSPQCSCLFFFSSLRLVYMSLYLYFFIFIWQIRWGVVGGAAARLDR